MDTENKMKNALESVKSRLGSIRAGRANPALLNGIMVSYYGTPTPIQSIANIMVPEARQLLIKPFDKNAVKDIEKAINIIQDTYGFDSFNFDRPLEEIKEGLDYSYKQFIERLNKDQ